MLLLYLMHSKLLYQIALTKIKGVGDIIARNLLEIIGDEEAIFKSTKKELSTIQGISSKLINEILNPDVLKLAEKELYFIERNKIQTFFIKDPDYPIRMKDCMDAPVLLYFKGNSTLNTTKVIGIVGTRKSTHYGNSFCNDFLSELSTYFPDTLIVSGLAYGIDINAHNSALKSNLPTVGVLAHGLDRIYPSAHRKTAIEMLNNGGLLTEFSSGTEPNKFNFVRRNRIIAGIADALIVVESDTKGGSLITADIANSYNKDVFAVPGRVTDQLSQGCNKLIADNKAVVLESVSGFLKQMNWIDLPNTKKETKQQTLFLDLTEDEQKIYDILSISDSVHVNTLSLETNIPISQLFFNLLEMEIKKIVTPLPGGQYKRL